MHNDSSWSIFGLFVSSMTHVSLMTNLWLFPISSIFTSEIPFRMAFRINDALCGACSVCSAQRLQRSVCSVTRIMFAAFRVECFGLPAFAASISDGNSSLPFSLRVQREIIRESEFGLFLRMSNIADWNGHLKKIAKFIPRVNLFKIRELTLVIILVIFPRK